MDAMQSRAGRTVAQAAGYLAYVPAPLPPDPPVRLDAEGVDLLSRADQAIGKLEGIATLLPEMERFGIATAADVGLETLVQRMSAEAIAGVSVIVGHFQIGAWSRV